MLKRLWIPGLEGGEYDKTFIHNVNTGRQSPKYTLQQLGDCDAGASDYLWSMYRALQLALLSRSCTFG